MVEYGRLLVCLYWAEKTKLILHKPYNLYQPVCRVVTNISVFIVIRHYNVHPNRRWQVEQSIKEMAWRINYEQLEWSDKHKATSGSMVST